MKQPTLVPLVPPRPTLVPDDPETTSSPRPSPVGGRGTGTTPETTQNKPYLVPIVLPLDPTRRQMRRTWPALASQQVYRLFDTEGRLLYVGVTHCIAYRMTGHRRRSPWFIGRPTQ